MSKALIVIDVQNDFVTGDLGTKEAQKALSAIEKLVDECYMAHDHIYYTRDTHDINYLQTQEGRRLPVAHCQYGSWGWRVVGGVDYSAGKTVTYLNKGQFGYDDWESEHLDQYEEVVICGLCTDICVISNALIIKSLYPELRITVVSSACAGTTPQRHLAALDVMRSCQIDIK